MVAMRVATFAQSNRMIADAMRVESVMANKQIQESTGVIATDFGGYGSDAQHVVNLQVSVTRAQSYVDAATLADSKIQVMYSAIGSMTDILTQLRSQLSAASTGGSTETNSVITTAQQMLQEMGSLMNTQYDGRYVFAGGKTDTAPVDLTSFSSGVGSTTAADTSYYKGDDEIASVRVASDETVSYGVTADNSAFEEVMRVLKFVANSTTLSSSDISSALDLAGTALDDTAAVQARLSNAASSIETASARQTDYKSYAETLSNDLTGVDVAAITAQLSTYQAQLTASYSALAKILSINLASYLK
ncbi:flagellar hook protein FlgL [Bradyrhizobium nanningense]|uniref:Flagellar hook protein FlgL n=1 Tax=Bradyrhizobium nanningense TaxID=1325118 RepID=A0A4Q0RZZ9_9BRAD|nr:flagellin [Bradyrhizobium nanningense]RXH25929.1 flagellar hook protein FlgL [Bradyrhizobium nanningense]RXH28807.1 flagellar hook protein FlgL [Bradyrhizobium nanningense]